VRITKEMIGKKVWLVPTGNAISRFKKTTPFEQAKEATITEFSRIKGKFIFTDSTRESCFTLRGLASSIDVGHNAGYTAYGNFAEVQSAIYANKVRSELRDKWQSMSDEDLIKIGALLNIN
jgi:hypothetical protein